MKRFNVLFGAFLLSTISSIGALVPSEVEGAVPQLINFQGILRDSGGNPVLDGSYSVTFQIYDAPTTGNILWTETQSVTTSGGAFNVFWGTTNAVPDSAFNGPNRYLGTTIESDPEMSPRFQLVSVGYAYRVNSVDGALGGTISGDVNVMGKANIGFGNTLTTDAALVVGAQNTASGNGATVVGGDTNTASGWKSAVGGGQRNMANGFTATVAGGGHNTASGSWTTVGGGSSNSANSTFSTIGGGSGNTANRPYSTIGGGTANNATDSVATISGGINNTANGPFATVGGGGSNAASSIYATVGGGSANAASGLYATVGGGASNIAQGFGSKVGGGGTNKATGSYSFVGGGIGHLASGSQATVAGGQTDTASAPFAAVGGGCGNHAGGSFAAVGGGFNNKAGNFYATVAGGDRDSATGQWSTVPGGQLNKAAGSFSFAVGRLAKALHGGTFVWADTTAADFASTGINQFLIRAGGGVGIGTNSPEVALQVDQDAEVAAFTGDNNQGLRISGSNTNDRWVFLGFDGGQGKNISQIGSRQTGTGSFLSFGTSSAYGFGITNEAMTIDPNGNVGFGTPTPTHPLHLVSGAHCTAGGTWTNASSRSYKTDIQPLKNNDYVDILEKLENLEVVRFRYKADPDREHIGLIAEDVPDEMASRDRKGIPTADAIAFLMAALKAQQAQILNLKETVRELQESR